MNCCAGAVRPKTWNVPPGRVRLDAYTGTPRDEPISLLTYNGIGSRPLSMDFLHHGIPTPTRGRSGVARRCRLTGRRTGRTKNRPSPRQLHTARCPRPVTFLLAHPNIASKHWIIRQYDHEVQGGSVIKPLVNPEQDGPGDAAVIRPKLNSDRAIAIGCGLQTGLGLEDARSRCCTAPAALDEAVRKWLLGPRPRIAVLELLLAVLR